MKTLNQKTVTAKLQRIELCDLMIACTAVAQSLEKEGHTATQWHNLHDKLSAIIDEFDSKQ